MTPPKARCVTCMEVIMDHDPTSTTQRPKYCKNPECRRTWKEHPICGRCRRPLPRPFRSAQRYHEHCRDGCAYCGQELPLHPRDYDERIKEDTKRLNSALDYLYCSKNCRNIAWSDQSMPNCPQCDTPTEFNPAARIWRNPPLYHDECRQDSAEWRRRRKNQKAMFFLEYERHQICRQATLLTDKLDYHNCREHYPFPIPPPTDLHPTIPTTEHPTFYMDISYDEYHPNEDLASGGWLQREDDHPFKPVHEEVSRYHMNHAYIGNRGLMLPWLEVLSYLDKSTGKQVNVDTPTPNNTATIDL